MRAANKRRYDSDAEFRADGVKRTKAYRAGRKAVIGGRTRKKGAKSKYRSGMEERLAPVLLAAGATYETHRFVYTGKPKGYTPDFILPNGIVAEVKGWFPSADRTKMKLVREQYPALDLRMILATPHAFITKKKTITQAQWCEKNGIKWADNDVPESWLREPKNWDSLASISAAIRVKRAA